MRFPPVCAALLLASSLAFAESDSSSKVVKGEVVSTDTSGHKLRYKTTTGDEKTAAVDASAAAKLTTLKSGDKVILTLRDTSGEQTVIAVKRTAAQKKDKHEKKALSDS